VALPLCVTAVVLVALRHAAVVRVPVRGTIAALRALPLAAVVVAICLVAFFVFVILLQEGH